MDAIHPKVIFIHPVSAGGRLELASWDLPRILSPRRTDLDCIMLSFCHARKGSPSRHHATRARRTARPAGRPCRPVRRLRERRRADLARRRAAARRAGSGCSVSGSRVEDLPPDLARWVEIDPSTDCWLWTRCTNRGNASDADPFPRGGYAQARWEGKVQRVHRVVYTLLVGPIPADRPCLDHTCHDPASCTGGQCIHRRCVNPEHLEPVTNAENKRRALKGRPPGISDGEWRKVMRTREVKRQSKARERARRRAADPR